jgi:uncharacterized DUF497 family protein
MFIIWDEPKRLANLHKHGLDFADVEDGFDFDNALALEAVTRGAGRQRVRLIGTLFGEIVVAVIVSPLGREALSVVSLRPASKKERALLWLNQNEN